MAGELRALMVITAAALAGGCRPTLDDRPWLVTMPRIVAVTIDPAEISPGQTVNAQVVAIDPSRALDPAAARWSLCRSGKPLGENRVVGDACIDGAPDSPDGSGSPAALTIPATACQLFGPDTPQPAPGAPPTRPRDPDASGGYYQPIAVSLGGARAVALARVTCGLPDASFTIARAFQTAYTPNRNPRVAGLSFAVDGAAVDPAATPIARGARVAVQLDWTDGDAEVFPIFDRDTRALVAAHERLDVAWYVTGGELDVAAAAIDDSSTLAATTTWTAPDTPGTVDVVAVIRDSRGGSAIARATLVVE